MGSVVIPELNCGNGSRMMPVLGMGTAAFPFDGSSSLELKAAILSAIKLGYRHFDTAALYNSEKSLGEAISEAIQLGLIKSRDELFITSKLWCTDAHKGRVLPGSLHFKTPSGMSFSTYTMIWTDELMPNMHVCLICRNLKLETLDLYLIHMPISIKPRESDFLITEEGEHVPMDFKSVWTDMEECQRLGLTKSIGVCNFSCKKLENLLDIANIPPAVNQVELNPLWQQKKLKEFCIAKGIVITAYSTFGSKGTVWGSNRVMECEVLNAIAKAKGKSIVQVCLRWVYEQGMSMVVKSFNEERLKENLKIFDWELSAEDLEMINEIPQSRGILHDHFLSPNGPFKSSEEFWDGEI